MNMRVLRLKDMTVYTGLSRSVIYERMNPKSPRYGDMPLTFQNLFRCPERP